MPLKYYSDLKTAVPMEAPATPSQPAQESPATPSRPAQESPEKDAVKMRMLIEQKSRELGLSTTVNVSSSNRTLSVSIDVGNDIITQRDAIKLASQLNDLNPSWRLMDEPLVKSGGSWAIKMAKVG